MWVTVLDATRTIRCGGWCNGEVAREQRERQRGGRGAGKRLLTPLHTSASRRLSCVNQACTLDELLLPMCALSKHRELHGDRQERLALADHEARRGE